MSDASEAIGTGGGVISIGTVVWFLLRRALNKGDKAEAAREADLRAEVNQLRERLNAALDNHRDQLEQLKRTAVEHDTRLKFREGAYGADPLTNPGLRPSPELQARLNEAKEESTK